MTEVRFPEYLDSTMLSQFSSCERMFQYSQLMGLRPTIGSIHLHAGGCFAHGLEVFRNQFYLEKKDKVTAFGQAVKAMAEFWGDYENVLNSRKDLWRLCEALWMYFNVWYPPATDLLQPLELGGKPSIEFSFSLPLPGCSHPVTGDPLFYVGRLDLIGTFNNQVFGLDEKTTQALGQSWNSKWELRSQFIGYAWALKEILSLPVVGIMVRGICFRAKDYDHAEVIVYTPQHLIDAWLEKTVHLVQRMTQSYKAGYWAPDYGETCASYGGCDYIQLCNKRDPTPWMTEDYEISFWDPLSRARLPGEQETSV